MGISPSHAVELHNATWARDHDLTAREGSLTITDTHASAMDELTLRLLYDVHCHP